MSYEPAHSERQFWTLDEFLLESGEVIEDFRLAYIVHGTPLPDGSNVVLTTSSLGGNAHRMDFMIGDNLPLDPADYCIISVDAIGNGWSSSPSNSRTQSGMNFPAFTIRDMVASQRRLLSEIFGFETFLAVIGASMGGMQALQWAVRYPKAMKAIVALVPLAKTPPWTIIANEISRRIIQLDPQWQGGAYKDTNFAGWRTCLSLTQTVVARSPQTVGTDKQSAIGWLDDIVDEALLRAFDANDWIAQTCAYDAHDLGTTPGFDGDTERALGAITVPALIMGPDLDLLNPSTDQQNAAAAIPNAQFVPIPSLRGHMAASPGDDADIRLINETTAAFLSAHR